jgi:hypothetical protein
MHSWISKTNPLSPVKKMKNITLTIAIIAAIASVLAMAFGLHPAIAGVVALVSICVAGAKLADILEPKLV